MRTRSTRACALAQRVTAAITAAACAVLVSALAAPPAQAAGGTLSLRLGVAAQVGGSGWTPGALVHLCRGAVEEGAVVVLSEFDPDTGLNAGDFAYSPDPEPRTGERWTAFVGSAGETCAAPGATSTSIEVTGLGVTRIEPSTGRVYGTGALASPATLQVWPESMYIGVGTQVWVTPNANGSWAAALQADEFDLMRGLAIHVQQVLAGGNRIDLIEPVPNPTISVWDTHGVAAVGWKQFSTLRMALFDPSTGGSLEWTVTTDIDGNYWDVPPDPAWQVLEPGWVAMVTGAVDKRERPVITKTIVVPDPVPLPTMTTSSIAGTLSGTATSETIGAGSLVSADASCSAGNDNQEIVTATGGGTPGAYNLTFSGFCGPEPNPVYSYGLRVRDLDGDEFSVNWRVTAHPGITLPDVVYGGEYVNVDLHGFDLGALTLRICTAAGCDPWLALVLNTDPDENWGTPAGHAGRQISMAFPRYLDPDADGPLAPVDCAAATGTCWLRATETHRPAVSVNWNLTFGFGPWLEVSPRTGLVDGAAVTVTGHGFPPSSTFFVDIAQEYGYPGNSLVDHSTWLPFDVPVTTDASGTFTVPMTLERVLHVSPMPADPTIEVDCALVVVGAGMRCGIFGGWTVTPTDPQRDYATFSLPTYFQPPAGPAGPAGPPGPTGATGPQGPPGAAAEAPLIALFAPGTLRVKAGKTLTTQYAVSRATALTATLTRKSVTLTKSISGSAGANRLSWKLVRKGKPLPTGTYTLALAAPSGARLTTTTVKVTR